MTTEISNSEDIIDSRQIIERIEELQGELDGLISDAREEISDNKDRPEDEQHEAALENLAEWLGITSKGPATLISTLTEGEGILEAFPDQSDEAKELTSLLALQEEAEGYAGDWQHGVTLIRDSYFEDYAQELADDIGAINRDATWPCNCIDWTRAANELKQDYTEVSFDGVPYQVR